MKAMVLTAPRFPLEEKDIPVPVPGPSQLLIKVSACAVCRTDLHVVDGELTEPKLPLVPGHEIIGTVVSKGEKVNKFAAGDRVGVPWLGSTCGACSYCRKGLENLCENALFTGYTINGGYAEFTAADEHFCFPVPPDYNDAEAAPLLCAGLIGYRSLKMAGDAERIGFYGFGAAAHILIQVALHQGRSVFAFTREGDNEGMKFALDLGAGWAGDSHSTPPEKLDAAIIFAPVGKLVPAALRAVDRGGIVVCAGIHMSDIPAFPYEILWGEKTVRSVANLTREDGVQFMELASKIKIHTEVQTFPLNKANDVLNSLREGRIQGAAVLIQS
jgi:propanol-preferring alcohol dehydrogenase